MKIKSLSSNWWLTWGTGFATLFGAAAVCVVLAVVAYAVCHAPVVFLLALGVVFVPLIVGLMVEAFEGENHD